MNSGKQAEQAVANYLKSQGYKILTTNWRSKIVEIDIVAQKAKNLYFIEVKYRSSELFGQGSDYINRRKLHKMRLGAESWVMLNNWNGDYELVVANVSGPDFEQIELMDVVS